MDILSRIKETIFLVPEEKFDSIASDKGYRDSFIYLLLGIIIMSILGGLAGIAQHLLNPKSATIEFLALLIIGTVLAIPVDIIIRYIIFGIMHLIIKLLGGTAPLLKTVQVYIYGSTPSMYLGWIPCVGWIFSLVSFANIVLGIKRVHNMSLIRVIIATVVIPIAVVMVLVITMVLIFGAAILAGLGGAGLLNNLGK